MSVQPLQFPSKSKMQPFLRHHQLSAQNLDLKYGTLLKKIAKHFASSEWYPSYLDISIDTVIRNWAYDADRLLLPCWIEQTVKSIKIMLEDCANAQLDQQIPQLELQRPENGPPVLRARAFDAAHLQPPPRRAVPRTKDAPVIIAAPLKLYRRKKQKAGCWQTCVQRLCSLKA